VKPPHEQQGRTRVKHPKATTDNVFVPRTRKGIELTPEEYELKIACLETKVEELVARLVEARLE
jgi:hypothetical protein